MNPKTTSVDEYIASFPTEVQEKLEFVRKTIIAQAPEAAESIAYGMPAYKMNKKPLVYFGGFDKHIGFYAIPSAHEKFRKELSVYKHGKGSVQFPLDQPLPIKLITDIVQFRIAEINKKQ